MKSVQAMIIADTLAALDSETLQLVAEVLVRKDPRVAEALEFSLGTSSMDARMVEKCYG
jgi:hypothetical protein